MWFKSGVKLINLNLDWQTKVARGVTTNAFLSDIGEENGEWVPLGFASRDSKVGQVRSIL